MKDLGKRIFCMNCQSELPDDLLIVGNQYPSAIYSSGKEKDIEKTSLNITQCSNKECRLVQLSNKYNLQQVFENYPYESATTISMIKILKDIVDAAKKWRKLDKSDIVLDIGGNDGTLLNLIGTKVKSLVNIDASNILPRVDKENYIHIRSRFNSKIYKDLGLPNPKIIFSIAMFYHLDDPNSFVKSVHEIMDDDSIWIVQMTYLGSMIENNIIDNVVHEHVAYYSLKSFQFLIDRNGLKIEEAEIVNSYGGSLRVYISKKTKKSDTFQKRNNYNLIEKYEKNTKLNDQETIIKFNDRIQAVKIILQNYLKLGNQMYGKIWGFGASTKGNMLLQYIETSNQEIEYILDNNKSKIGTITLGTEIPIIDEQENLYIMPKIIFILPYYYSEAFIQLFKMKKITNKIIIKPLPFPSLIEI